jgi:hypothetical protein
MKQLLWYVGCCWTLSLASASAAHASPDIKSSANLATGNAASLGGFSNTDYYAPTATPVVPDSALAQVPPAPPSPTETPGSIPPKPSSTPPNSENKEIQDRLNNINNDRAPAADKFNSYQPRTSPGFAIFNPVGFGADNNLVFFALSYQSHARFTDVADSEGGIGIGLGDAVNSIGAELSYSINSFGSSAGFGSGAFNAKLHKRLSEDSAVAIGWNQFATIYTGPGKNGTIGTTDYPRNSYYAVGSKIFRTRDDINEPFSRVAVTGGVGSGVFLPFDGNTLDRTGLNAFGSVGVRVARPVSAIVEWTGQDLSAGLSIAPFENFPLVITPAFRDIAGVTDPLNNRTAGARFVLGASVAFNF